MIGRLQADHIETALRAVRPVGKIECFGTVNRPVFKRDVLVYGTIGYINRHVNRTSEGFASLEAVLHLLGSMRVLLGDDLVDNLSSGIGRLMQAFVIDQKGGTQ